MPPTMPIKVLEATTATPSRRQYKDNTHRRKVTPIIMVLSRGTVNPHRPTPLVPIRRQRIRPGLLAETRRRTSEDLLWRTSTSIPSNTAVIHPPLARRLMLREGSIPQVGRRRLDTMLHRFRVSLLRTRPARTTPARTGRNDLLSYYMLL